MLYYLVHPPSRYFWLLFTFWARFSGNKAHEHSAVHRLIHVPDVRLSHQVMNASQWQIFQINPLMVSSKS